ncbi:hypothetical protein Dsin_016988 [Dipteronia sinensis]|uniref:Reverse transcriptase domain-containing protein n=1 Tax=Dipteronia sinensis TaxID=43782 RepID=A0AAE0AFG9_9ROSI|nr:hypothetical protein Dsin_016988 [Dipteronia sinensis]
MKEAWPWPKVYNLAINHLSFEKRNLSKAEFDKDEKSDVEGGILVKLEFEKTYDSVDHDFLDSMMEDIGFGLRWRKWIKDCISTPLLSVLVNGSPTPQFGLEGDPLFPFLFNLVVEGLSALFRKAYDLNRIMGASFGNNDVHISHLQFANDTILF